MKYCEYCASAMDDDQEYCPNCGKKSQSVSRRRSKGTVEDRPVDYSRRNIPEAKGKDVKEGINVAPKAMVITIVVVFIVVAIGMIVVGLGYFAELEFDGDLSIKLHEYVVDRSEAQKVATVYQKTENGDSFDIEEYGYDLNKKLYYSLRLTGYYNGNSVCVDFNCLDKENNKEYDYYAIVNCNIYDLEDDKITLESHGVMYSQGKDAEYYISRVRSNMSSPGRGCSNYSEGRALKGDMTFHFTFGGKSNDKVVTENFLVKEVRFFNEMYYYKYECDATKYFILA